MGGPNDGLESELDPEKYPTPPALWRVPGGGDKFWAYYYSPENKTYYVRRGVHDG